MQPGGEFVPSHLRLIKAAGQHLDKPPERILHAPIVPASLPSRLIDFLAHRKRQAIPVLVQASYRRIFDRADQQHVAVAPQEPA